MNKKSELKIRLAIYKAKKRINELTQKDGYSQEKVVELKRSINGYNLMLASKKSKLNQLIIRGLRVEILLLQNRFKRCPPDSKASLSRKIKTAQLFLRYFKLIDESRGYKKAFENDICRFLYSYGVNDRLRYLRTGLEKDLVYLANSNNEFQWIKEYIESGEPLYELRVSDLFTGINNIKGTTYSLFFIESGVDFKEVAENFKKDIENTTNLYKENVLFSTLSYPSSTV